MIATARNTIVFEIKIESRKFQLTVLQLSSASDRKITDGRANVPTKVLRPFASVLVMMFSRPARYLQAEIGREGKR